MRCSISAGWTPSVHLFSQSRGKVAFDAADQRFLPGTYAQDCVSVGACNGTDDLQRPIDEALAPASAKARDSGGAPRQGATPAAGERRSAGRAA